MSLQNLIIEDFPKIERVAKGDFLKGERIQNKGQKGKRKKG
jgi:hypothetical protein